MFTGLVQKLGTVLAVSSVGDLLSIDCGFESPKPGESIAVNGCCLTVAVINPGFLSFQVGPETLARTNLGRLKPGHRVNLERALRIGDPLGGHIVTGHIDAVGTIRECTPNGEWRTLWFDCPPGLDDLLVHKGSIAIDGVSLTLVDVEPGRFSVMLIPHTLAHTTLGLKAVGDSVNLEADLMAKHVKKLFQNLTIEI